MPWQMQWTGGNQPGNWGQAAWANNQAKGQGKGKGKDEPSGRKWPCPSAKCKEHHKGSALMMLPHHLKCTVCLTPKAAAPAIQQASLLKLREEAKAEQEEKAQAPLSKRKQKLARNAETKRLAQEKEKEKQGGAAQAPAPKALAAPPKPPNVAGAKAPSKEEWLAKELPEELLKEVGKTPDVLESILSSVALDKFPSALCSEELEREASTKLAAIQPAGNEALRQSTVALIEDLRSQITLGEGRLPSDIIDTMKARATLEEANLVQLDKKVQPRALKRATLVQNKSEALRVIAESDERSKSGLAKSERRCADRFQLVDHALATLQKLKNALQQHDQSFAEAHAVRGVAVDAMSKALIGKYDKLIESTNEEEVTMETDEAAGEAAEAAAAAAEPPSPETAQLEAWKLKFAELQKTQAAEAVHMQDQIQLLVEGQKTALAQKTADDAAIRVAAKAAEATKAFDAVVEVDPSTLPDYQPDAVALEASSHLYSLLQQWSLRGGMVPFTLGDLREGLSKATSKNLRAILTAMLGPVWTKLFPTELVEEAILPRQAVLIAMHALDLLKAKFDGIQATQEAAAKSYTVLVESSKKRRASAATA